MLKKRVRSLNEQSIPGEEKIICVISDHQEKHQDRNVQNTAKNANYMRRKEGRSKIGDIRVHLTQGIVEIMTTNEFSKGKTTDRDDNRHQKSDLFQT